MEKNNVYDEEEEVKLDNYQKALKEIPILKEKILGGNTLFKKEPIFVCGLSKPTPEQIKATMERIGGDNAKNQYKGWKK